MGCHCNTHQTPKFPLAYNLWRFGSPLTGPPDQTGRCQLHVSGLTAGPTNGSLATADSFVRWLYLPRGTDVRGDDLRPAPDTVEVPAGSKRMYQITSVDDSAKGFPNEFRVAQMVPVLPPFMGLVNPYWPTPYP